MLIESYSAWPILCRTMASIPLEHEAIMPDALTQRITEIELLLETLQSHQSTVETIEQWASSGSIGLASVLLGSSFCFPELWLPTLLGSATMLMIPLSLFIYRQCLDSTITQGREEREHLQQMHDTVLLGPTPPPSPTPSTATLCSSVDSDSTWVSEMV
jgi:hypothetical protein